MAQTTSGINKVDSIGYGHFKQQNLPAWQPILTAGTVLPTFFLIGVAFLPIGIGLLMSSTSVHEIVLDYTNCKSAANSSITCAQAQLQSQTCTCRLTLELTQDFRKNVYVYYGLTNFYQNHRRYVKSRDDNQLLGNPLSVSSECYPFDFDTDPGDGKRKPVAPCGAIANSIFNDTFELKFDGNQPVTISKYGIAWSSDKTIRFQNPSSHENLAKAFEGTVKPPNWPKPVYELDDDSRNNGFQNEGLMVWMRTAALPTFRKLYGIIGNDQVKKDTGKDLLPRGNYTLEIDYNFPVTAFGGKKRFILSNTSWLGGKNHFLGIAYILVGCLCFVLSAIFVVIHKRYGKLSREIVQINQRTPYLS
ncbi:Cell cycle control protein 50A, partial [Fragariocoptes setiger]